MTTTVNQFTFALRVALITSIAGDFWGPVTDAAGTPYFEPDGVTF
jgi:hypothetical protein